MCYLQAVSSLTSSSIHPFSHIGTGAQKMNTKARQDDKTIWFNFCLRQRKKNSHTQNPHPPSHAEYIVVCPIIFFIDCKPQFNTLNLLILAFLNRIEFVQPNTFTIHAECTWNLGWTLFHQYPRCSCTPLWFENCLATIMKVMLCSHSALASARAAHIEVLKKDSVSQ